MDGLWKARHLQGPRVGPETGLDDVGPCPDPRLLGQAWIEVRVPSKEETSLFAHPVVPNQGVITTHFSPSMSLCNAGACSSNVWVNWRKGTLAGETGPILWPLPIPFPPWALVLFSLLKSKEDPTFKKKIYGTLCSIKMPHAWDRLASLF